LQLSKLDLVFPCLGAFSICPSCAYSGPFSTGHFMQAEAHSDLTHPLPQGPPQSLVSKTVVHQ
jgi:hypothetical protein